MIPVLQNLIRRTFNPESVVQPRPTSRFEPSKKMHFGGLDTGVSGYHGAETIPDVRREIIEAEAVTSQRFPWVGKERLRSGGVLERERPAADRVEDSIGESEIFDESRRPLKDSSSPEHFPRGAQLKTHPEGSVLRGISSPTRPDVTELGPSLHAVANKRAGSDDRQPNGDVAAGPFAASLQTRVPAASRDEIVLTKEGEPPPAERPALSESEKSRRGGNERDLSLSWIRPPRAVSGSVDDSTEPKTKDRRSTPQAQQDFRPDFPHDREAGGLGAPRTSGLQVRIAEPPHEMPRRTAPTVKRSARSLVETEMSVQPQPEIHVTIGRVEVRAEQVPARAPMQKTSGPALSLDEYLKQRSEGGKR